MKTLHLGEDLFLGYVRGTRKFPRSLPAKSPTNLRSGLAKATGDSSIEGAGTIGRSFAICKKIAFRFE